MFKKFFVAAILGLLVMSSQIASAYDYDWSQAPRIVSKAQLAKYIEDGRRRGQTEFNFVLTNVKVNNESEQQSLNNKICNELALTWNSSLVIYGYGTGRLKFVINKEYPGTRVANAYLSRQPDIAWKNLDDKERLLYSKALPIVNEANKRSSEIEKARYIYDKIREWGIFFELNKNTAADALLYKKANCVGFTDAFYMLGRMCNLNVRRIGGYTTGGHAWNIITYSDGKIYFIDVLHGHFNETKEQIEKTHKWDREIIPNLQ